MAYFFIFSEYNKDLKKELTSETSGDYQEIVCQLLEGERDQSNSIDHQEAETDAKKLYNVKQ